MKNTETTNPKNKINKSYKLILILNLILFLIALIFFIIIIIKSSFANPDGRKITVVTAVISLLVVVFDILILIYLSKSDKKGMIIPKCFKVAIIILSLPTFFAMLLKPEESIDIFRDLISKDKEHHRGKFK